jgi:Secretion system C-terminal sorting domain
MLGLVRPNPARTVLSFSLSLPEAGRASVKVFNVEGRLVATAFEGTLSAGPHDVSSDTAELGLAAGVYFLRLDALGRQETRRFVLVR